ncbi:nucleolin 2-like [Populus nigra]|uniref:nucleolin 2-like n=1 Tax=Populus nigra TaxID=3691 RepID=UPI002B274DAC|nr:nucleolin 2-like [Populus nigra]
MGKSSKKSATKVEAAPAVIPAKAGKQGKNKREAEEALEKIVSAKKQKKNDGVAQAVQKAKVETKTLKKKKHESSDSDDSSSEDEEVKVLPKKAVKPTKPPAKESSDSESDSGSELESDEEPPVKATPAKEPIAVKNGSHGAAAKKGKDDSSSSESSEDESSDDEEIPAKASAPKNVPAQPATIKKVELSDDSESDSDDSESTDDDKGASTKAAYPKKVPAPAAQKKADSSDDDSDSDESSSEDEAPAAKAAVASKKPSSVTETKESKQAKATAQKESSSEEESSSDGSESEEDSEDEKPAKTPKKNDTDVEMVDADIKTPKTPVTPVAHENTGSKTLFVGNLSFQVERADVESFFKGAGEVADVRFALDADERFRGFGHVEFTTAEAAQKALKLHGTTLLGRDVRLDLAREKGSNTPYSKDSSSFPKGGSGQSQTIFVKGFDKSAGEDEIRSSLQEHFGSCGEIKRVSIPTDYDTGAIKGMAYLEFNDADALSKAFELNGSQLGEYYLTVDEAKPRSDNRDSRDSGRGRGRGSGGRGRGGRFDSGRGGRFDSGRGGRGGRGRGTPFKPSVTTAASGKKKTFNDDY